MTTENSKVLTANDELMTINETKLKLKVSRQAIWKWRRQGLIQGHKMGGKVYFLQSELMDAIKRS